MVRGILVCFALLYVASAQIGEWIAQELDYYNVPYMESKGEWTAQELVMRGSNGDLCRGYFINNDETIMMKKRSKGIEVPNTIQFIGSDTAGTFFSRDFEDKSSSGNFLKTVDNFGTQVAVHANLNYLVVSAKAGHSVNSSNNHSKEMNTTSSTDYFSSIKAYNIPIKSVDLDPLYMTLNAEVINTLKTIERNSNPVNQRLHFIDFFEHYGSHFLTGEMTLGGTLIVQGITNIVGRTVSTNIKDTVKKATNTFLDISATFDKGGGGGGITTSAYDLKSHFSTNVNTKTLRTITLKLIKKGGPPGVDNITKWKEELVKQIDTWRVIDKSTDLIAIWDLIRQHHDGQFNDAEKFASLMKGAWKYVISLPGSYIPSDDFQAMSVLAAEFGNLGVSPSLADQRKQLIVDMVAKGKLGAQEGSRYAHIHVIPGGQVVMSALQKEPLDPGTTLLQFGSVMFLSEIPHMVYLKLEHKNVYLGHIIITLDGYMDYPKRMQQFLELSTGNNKEDGAWKGAGFNWGSPYAAHLPYEWIGCGGYRNDRGLQGASLFPVEGEGDPDGPAVAGNVLGWKGQSSAFTIRIHIQPNSKVVDPIIGHVTSGLDVLREVADRGDAYFKAVSFTDSGLVLIN